MPVASRLKVHLLMILSAINHRRWSDIRIYHACPLSDALFTVSVSPKVVLVQVEGHRHVHMCEWCPISSRSLCVVMVIPAICFGDAVGPLLIKLGEPTDIEDVAVRNDRVNSRRGIMRPKPGGGDDGESFITVRKGNV